MSTGCTIGIDAGTSACKGVLLGADGRLLATATETYPTRRTLDGEVTQDARDWLAATEAVLRRCAEPAAGPVTGIAVTAPAHNVVLVGESAEPLERVILWSDTRCREVAKELDSEIGETVLECMYVRLGPAWSLPQLAWLRRRRPGLFERVRLVLPAKDFIRGALGADPVTDPSDAAGTAMWDQRSGEWMPEAVERAGLALEQMPAVAPAHGRAGGLSAGWARRTGLLQGTPLVVGATDTAAELVALNAVEPGDGLIKIASTGTVVAVTGRPRPDPRLLTYPHAVADRWYAVAATNTAATASAWLQRVVFEDAVPTTTIYELMDAAASRAVPGAGGLLFLPFLEGERCPHWDPELRGAFVGLRSAHGRDDLCRAVLEGVALSLRACRELMADLGIGLSDPRLAGGGMASPSWREILVSVVGEAGVLQEPQGPAVGAAILASGEDAAPVVLAAETEIVRPREDWSETYNRLYRAYRSASEALAPVSHMLAEHSSIDLQVAAMRPA